MPTIEEAKAINETQMRARFIGDNPQPKVMKEHQSIIKSIYEDVFDAQLGKKIPLVPIGGAVCWPDTLDATKFTYEYTFSTQPIAYRFRQYLESRHIDPRDFAMAMAAPHLPEWKDLLEKARKIL